MWSLVAWNPDFSLDNGIATKWKIFIPRLKPVKDIKGLKIIIIRKEKLNKFFKKPTRDYKSHFNIPLTLIWHHFFTTPAKRRNPPDTRIFYRTSNTQFTSWFWGSFCLTHQANSFSRYIHTHKQLSMNLPLNNLCQVVTFPFSHLRHVWSVIKSFG
jgi:hypothetical protein